MFPPIIISTSEEERKVGGAASGMTHFSTNIRSRRELTARVWKPARFSRSRLGLAREKDGYLPSKGCVVKTTEDFLPRRKDPGNVLPWAQLSGSKSDRRLPLKIASSYSTSLKEAAFARAKRAARPLRMNSRHRRKVIKKGLLLSRYIQGYTYLGFILDKTLLVLGFAITSCSSWRGFHLKNKVEGCRGRGILIQGISQVYRKRSLSSI